MSDFVPAYQTALESGHLTRVVAEAFHRLRACTLCPRDCGVDRVRGEEGFCRTGLRAKLASYGPHFGEERPLVGTGGSGTLFLAECNMRCTFCQNWDISWGSSGTPAGLPRLARVMSTLQAQGCHNVNWVTPSHVVPQLLGGLLLAARRGLHVPVVYNSSGYDSVETLRLLDGVVDIYMPDLKWVSEQTGAHLAQAPEYGAVAQAAVREMHRQVGDLQLDARGVARRGLLVRHLVMPGKLADSEAVLRFLAEEISPQTYVNVMGQYRPAGDARGTPPLDRRVRREEVAEARDLARKVGLARLDGVTVGLRRMFF